VWSNVEYYYLVQYRECCLLPSCKSDAKPAVLCVTWSPDVYITQSTLWQLGKELTSNRRNWHELWAGCTLRCIRMIRFGPKPGQIGPKRVKSGTFSDLNEPKYTEICPEKVTDLSRLGPIWPTFGPNPTSSLTCILFSIQSRQHKPIIDTCTLHYYHCYTPAYTLYNFTYLNWSRGGEVSAFHCISIMIGF